ncbi:hypothetical protein MCC10078_1450 [Bifidobacterium longum subsp. longum]|nr:hypothetical protein MCC10078_1450 [Bifidobacterium longum subsp. longum]
MLIPSAWWKDNPITPSLSRRVNANSQLKLVHLCHVPKLIKKGEC